MIERGLVSEQYHQVLTFARSFHTGAALAALVLFCLAWWALVRLPRDAPQLRAALLWLLVVMACAACAHQSLHALKAWLAPGLYMLDALRNK